LIKKERYIVGQLIGEKGMFPKEGYRIVMADDHVLIRHGLKSILEEKTHLEMVGEAGDGLELLDLLSRLARENLTPHMVILDISMPKLGGIEATPRIKKICPDIKILILSMHKSREYFNHVISLGADGYLLKEDTATELISAIEMVKNGGVYVSPHLSGK
jgi:DNA-binding NarL/FixJ family response regulator